MKYRYGAKSIRQAVSSYHFDSMNADHYDVIIIGGSYAGLAAALALGRSLRRTLILDAGNPCNRQAPHSQNFLTQDGQTPSEMSALAQKQVLRYPSVSLRNTSATDARATTQGFEVSTEEGNVFRCRKLIMASGIRDAFPDIQGIRDCWGISVIHCPYCHGFEHKGQRAGILANGQAAMHLAPLVHNLNKDLCILSNGPGDFDANQRARLQRNGVRLRETPLEALLHTKGQLYAVRFHDGSEMKLDTLYAVLPFHQGSALPEKLGCRIDAYGYLAVNEFYETSIAGVYACGDNTSLMRSLSKTVFSGNVAGASANKALAEEDFS